MRFESRLRRLELATGGCPECGGPPGPETPFEVKVHEWRRDRPKPEPERPRCQRCGLPGGRIIKVRGLDREA